jgi:hypothetical protein
MLHRMGRGSSPKLLPLGSFAWGRRGWQKLRVCSNSALVGMAPGYQRTIYVKEKNKFWSRNDRPALAMALYGASMWTSPRKECGVIQWQHTNGRIGAMACNLWVSSVSPPHTGTCPPAQNTWTCPITPLHIAGKENSMMDIPLRSFGSKTKWHCNSS